MLLLHYDPVTTELVLKETTASRRQVSQEIIANLSEMIICTNLTLNRGMITVNNSVEITDTGSLEIGSGAIFEVV